MKCSPTFTNSRGLGEIFANIGVMSVMWLCWTWHSLLILMTSAATTPYPNEAMMRQMWRGRTPSRLRATMWWWHALTQISHLVTTMCPGPYHHHNATVTTTMTTTLWLCPPLHPWALPVYDVMSWRWWCAPGHITTAAWHHHRSPTTMWSLCRHGSMSHDDVDMLWAMLPPSRDDDDDDNAVSPPPSLHPHVDNNDDGRVAPPLPPNRRWQWRQRVTTTTTPPCQQQQRTTITPPCQQRWRDVSRPYHHHSTMPSSSSSMGHLMQQQQGARMAWWCTFALSLALSLSIFIPGHLVRQQWCALALLAFSSSSPLLLPMYSTYSISYKYISVSSIAGVNRTMRRSEQYKNLWTCIILYRTYVAVQCCTDY